MNGPASDSTVLTLRMALTSNNLPGLETALFDVSTPGNKLYGQHLSKEEVEAYVAPSSEAKSAAGEWLSSNGIQATAISPAGDWLNFNIEVSKANELFNAEFSVFANEVTGGGHGFPDILAQGANLVVFNGGSEVTFNSTDCSTPIVSSVIALLNAERIEAGNSVLGFLNPLIYGIPGLFTDITSGDNPGCNTNGFSATTGWDPVS